MHKLCLPDGVRYGYDSSGQRICVGSQMGRRDLFPANPNKSIKLQLQRVPMVDGGAYDKWGAYWGSGEPLYCAFSADMNVQIFVRADDHEQAKVEVRKKYPEAKFWR